MRDSGIHALFGRIRQTEGLVMAQLEFLQTRVHSMEIVQGGARLWERLLWAWSPAAYWRKVDMMQGALILKARQDRALAAEEAKKRAAGQKLLLVPQAKKIEVVRG